MPRNITDTVLLKIIADIKGVPQAVDSVITSVGSLDKRVSESTSKSSANLLQFSIAAGAMAATTAAAFKAVSDKFLEFDKRMALVRAVTDASSVTFEQMNENVRELGVSAGIGASEAADAMLVFSRIGFQANEIFDLLTPTVKLATSQQHDFGQTAELVSSTIKAFGLNTEEANRVVNLFAATSSKTAADLQKLQVSMQFVAPVSKTLGISVEETASALGFLFNAGLRASRAGTSLRRVLSSLIDPSAKSRKAMNQLGLEYDKLNPATNSLADVIKELSKSFDKTGKPARQLFQIFGQRGVVAAAILADAVNEDNFAFENMTETLRDTAEASRQFEQQMETLSGQFRRIKSLIDDAAIGLGDSMAPAFGFVFDAIENVLTGFRKLPSELKATTGLMGGAVAAAASLTAGVAALGWAVSALAKGLAALKIGALLTNPVGIAIAAIAALSVAIVGLIGHTERLRKQREEDLQRSRELAAIYFRLKEEIKEIGENSEEAAIKKEKLNRVTHELAAINSDLIDSEAGVADGLVLIDDKVRILEAGIKSTGESHTEMIEKMKKELDELKSKYDDQLSKVKELKSRTEEAQRATPTGVTQTIPFTDIPTIGSAARAGAAQFEIKGLMTQTDEAAKILDDLAKQIEEKQAQLEKITKSGAEKTVKNYEELADGAGKSLQSLLNRMDLFIMDMQNLINRYNNEIEQMGLTGFAAEKKGIETRTENEIRSINRRIEVLKDAANKEENLTKEAQVKLNKSIAAAEKVKEKLKEKSNAAIIKLDKKYSKEYSEILKNINKETEISNKQRDSIFEDNLDSRIAAIDLETEFQKQALQKQLMDIEEKFSGESQKEKELLDLKKALIDQDVANTKLAMQKKEKILFDNFVSNIDLIEKEVSASKDSEISKAKQIIDLRNQVLEETKLLYGEQSQEYQKMLLSMQAAEKELRAAEIKMATGVIGGIGDLVTGATGELLGLDREAQRVFGNIADSISNLATADFMGSIFSLTNVIASNILRAKKNEEDRAREQQEWIEERMKAEQEAHTESLKAAREMKSEWIDFQKSVHNVGNSIEEITKDLFDMRSSIEGLAGIEEATPDIDVEGLLVRAFDQPELASAFMKAWEERIRIVEEEGRNSENAIKSGEEVLRIQGMLAETLGLTEKESRVLKNKFMEMAGATSGVNLELKNYSEKHIAAARVVDALRDKNFDTIREMDSYINTLKSASDVTNDLGFSVINAADLIDVGKTRLAQALEDAGDDPAAVAAAYDSFKNLMNFIKSDPRLWDQFNFSEKVDFNAMVSEVQNDITDSFKDIADSIKNVFDSYSDSFNDSLGNLNDLFEMGGISFDQSMALLDSWGETLSESIPKDIADGINSAIDSMKLDLVTSELDRIASSLSNISSEMNNIKNDLEDLSAKERELTLERDFLTSPLTTGGQRQPEFTITPEMEVRGLTPAEEIAKLTQAADKVITALEQDIFDIEGQINNTTRYLLNELPQAWQMAISEMNDEMNSAAQEARDESQKTQNEILEERHRLMTDFAFTESQNERSARMRRIRELDRELAEERSMLASRLRDIEEQRSESQTRINEDYRSQEEDLWSKLDDLWETWENKREDRTESIRDKWHDVAVIQLKARNRINEITAALEGQDGIIERRIAAENRLTNLVEERTKLLIQQENLEAERLKIVENIQMSLIESVNAESIIRRNIVDNILPTQLSLINSITSANNDTLSSLMQQKDVWSDIKNIIDSIPLTALGLSEEDMLKANLARQIVTPGTRAFEQRQNIPGAANGAIVKKPSIVAVAEHNQPEIIAPLDKLPNIMQGLANRLPNGNSKNIIININDNIDMRGSIATVNDPNEIDKFYKDVMIPAKKRNMKKYRNTLTEVIE